MLDVVTALPLACGSNSTVAEASKVPVADLKVYP